jgi:hypothetical protein
MMARAMIVSPDQLTDASARLDEEVEAIDRQDPQGMLEKAVRLLSGSTLLKGITKNNAVGVKKGTAVSGSGPAIKRSNGNGYSGEDAIDDADEEEDGNDPPTKEEVESDAAANIARAKSRGKGGEAALPPIHKAIPTAKSKGALPPPPPPEEEEDDEPEDDEAEEDEARDGDEDSSGEDENDDTDGEAADEIAAETAKARIGRRAAKSVAAAAPAEAPLAKAQPVAVAEFQAGLEEFPEFGSYMDASDIVKHLADTMAKSLGSLERRTASRERQLRLELHNVQTELAGLRASQQSDLQKSLAPLAQGLLALLSAQSTLVKSAADLPVPVQRGIVYVERTEADGSKKSEGISRMEVANRLKKAVDEFPDAPRYLAKLDTQPLEAVLSQMPTNLRKAMDL